ncbi:uncharacterized protein Z518_02529 [Rhinocladiella mackenziei CBS 650.93]|uniref:Protein kinase domain-containing protein n=1 Tax=Rhinocladiella mackenziei CBS 650.93 TaxID=1442369 RepID=A0A0D2JF77_9EURO|nr:uncharacterized protein Z518_02529 [Rhinocladiella mackenziei CBS 650.93]KIX07875.1 hypothetical protein Z518_02529 [Rhinocladiella mackenziei CBS 650.93]
MEPVGIALAAASMADLCIKCGKSLVAKYRSYQTAERDILELILRVEHHWLKTECQVEFLRSVWSDLGEHLQVHQNSILRVLYLKINETTLLIDQIIGNKDDDVSVQSVLTENGHYRKGKFALMIKDCLHKTLNDLATWQEMLDPSWFLMTRVSGTAIDQQLTFPNATRLSSATTVKGIRDELRTTNNDQNESIFIAVDTLAPGRNSIPFSFSQSCHDQRSADLVIVDPFSCDALTDVGAVTKDIRNLARVLSKIDPLVFGLLSCRGVIKYTDADGALSRFEFVFSIPPSLRNPSSLRSILVEERDDHAFNDRLDLAKQLASSILFIHSSGFVHKNIRPETILVFTGDSLGLGYPFLVGFEKFRPTDRLTYRVGDARWERNLYRHPQRQGISVEEDFKMQHDIYSLGVCLLEIGLWTSFVLWKEDADEPTPSRALGIDDVLKLKDERKTASEVKKVLIRMAEECLPNRMGKRYTEVVLACLTCLDKGATGLGDERDFLDVNGTVVAVRYIEKVPS